MTVKLAKVGAGEKVHAGWEVLNSDGTRHHIALHCNTYPFRPARFIGPLENINQITCDKCRQCMLNATTGA